MVVPTLYAGLQLMTRLPCSAVTIAEKGGESTVENMLTVVGAKEKKFSMAIRCVSRAIQAGLLACYNSLTRTPFSRSRARGSR